VHSEIHAHAVSIRQGPFHLTFPEMVIPAISRYVKPFRPDLGLKTEKAVIAATFCGPSPTYPLFRAIITKGKPERVETTNARCTKASRDFAVTTGSNPRP
jgi:hypothetical protein